MTCLHWSFSLVSSLASLASLAPSLLSFVPSLNPLASSQYFVSSLSQIPPTKLMIISEP
jgi:hypothetical protein